MISQRDSWVHVGPLSDFLEQQRELILRQFSRSKVEHGPYHPPIVVRRDNKAIELKEKKATRQGGSLVSVDEGLILCEMEDVGRSHLKWRGMEELAAVG